MTVLSPTAGNAGREVRSAEALLRRPELHLQKVHPQQQGPGAGGVHAGRTPDDADIAAQMAAVLYKSAPFCDGGANANGRVHYSTAVCT